MENYFEDYLLNLQELHDDMIATLKDLPPEALDWSPAEDVNSINVLVTHTAGAERFLIGDLVARDAGNRDRDSEFKVHGLDAGVLTQRLNESMAYNRSIMDGMSLDDLSARRDFREGEASVARILDHALKHTGTHLGHIQLMRQFWEMYGKQGD